VKNWQRLFERAPPSWTQSPSLELPKEEGTALREQFDVWARKEGVRRWRAKEARLGSSLPADWTGRTATTAVTAERGIVMCR
jgi:hypothetical protein